MNRWMFCVLMFPASEGDCLLVEYGDPAAPQRILIDGGRKATYETHLRRYLKAIPRAQRRLRLFVVSHIDRDHIEGAVAFLRDTELELDVEDVWFNAYSNLISDAPPTQDLSALDGEALTLLIARRGWLRNRAFFSGAVSTGEPPTQRPIALGDGAELTLLTPGRKDLERLKPRWDAECKKAGITPGASDRPADTPPLPTLGDDDIDPVRLAASHTPPDTSKPNGTSITFILSYAGKRVLFCADARPTQLLSALKRLGGSKDTPLLFDAIKVPHHASKANVTSRLMTCLQSPRFLVSTDGILTGHPDPEGIARIVVAGGPPRRLYFNYRNDRTLRWNRPDWQQTFHYDTIYGSGTEPLRVDLLGPATSSTASVSR